MSTGPIWVGVSKVGAVRRAANFRVCANQTSPSISRKFILGAMISFVKQHHSKCNRPDGKMQQFVYAKLKDSRSVVARTAQLLMIDAFRKAFWRDAKTANVLSECVFHKVVRLQVGNYAFQMSERVALDGYLPSTCLPSNYRILVLPDDRDAFLPRLSERRRRHRGRQ